MASLEEQIEATKHTLDALEEEKKKRDTENDKIRSENQRYLNMQNHLQQILSTVRELKVEFLDVKRRVERLEEQNHFKNLNDLPPFEFFNKKSPKDFIETIGSILNVKQKVQPMNEVNVPYKTVSDSSESESEISNISLEIEAFDKKKHPSSPVSDTSILTSDTDSEPFQKDISNVSSGSLTPPIGPRGPAALIPPLVVSSTEFRVPLLEELLQKTQGVKTTKSLPTQGVKTNPSLVNSDTELSEHNLREHNVRNPFEKQVKEMKPIPVEFTANISNERFNRPLSRNSSSSSDNDEKKPGFFGWNY
jgi:hypothetical protein